MANFFYLENVMDFRFPSSFWSGMGQKTGTHMYEQIDESLNTCALHVNLITKQREKGSCIKNQVHPIYERPDTILVVLSL